MRLHVGAVVSNLNASQTSAGGKRETIKTNQDQDLSRILEYAVVVSWADLIRGAQTGLVNIEYGFAPSGALDFLQVGSAISRGHWLLAGSCWMSLQHFTKPAFTLQTDMNQNVSHTSWNR